MHINIIDHMHHKACVTMNLGKNPHKKASVEKNPQEKTLKGFLWKKPSPYFEACGKNPHPILRPVENNPQLWDRWKEPLNFIKKPSHFK